MKRVTLFLGVLLALAVANPMWAQGMHSQKMGMHGGKMMGQGMHQMMGQMHDGGCAMMGAGHMQGLFLNQAEDLGLNDSQVARLEKLKSETQKALIQKQADMKVAQLELNELLQDAKAKRSDLESKAKKLEELRSDTRMTAFNAQLDARAVLTPEQLQKAKFAQCDGMQNGMMQHMGSDANGDACPMMGKSESPDGMSQHEMHHPGSK